ncbi:MAG: hypothetical protein BMS9Abin31_0862 [Gammaproteobacteria bacterium]|nr:MAG: hypothetical protein BMS9Abin31_0862 [Gammaproteobacteria bacterium]
MTTQAIKAKEYFIKNKPYYEAAGDEIDIFGAAASLITQVASGLWQDSI